MEVNLTEKSGQGHSAVETANILNEEDLMNVFSNSHLLDVNDLLNFRLVSRKWRNAATSVLLHRSDCQVLLKLGVVTESNQDSKLWEQQASKFVFFSGRVAHPQPGHLLKAFMQLVQDSPKFPCVNFAFDYKAFKDNENGEGMNEEFKQLFDLHGHRIKIVSMLGKFPLDHLRHILLVGAPKLECLQVSAYRSVDSTQKLFSPSDSNTTSASISLKKISLTTEFLDANDLFNEEMNFRLMLLKEIFQVATKLESIENVHVVHLRAIVEERKVHLVRELKVVKSKTYYLHSLQTFAADQPCLRKLSLTLDDDYAGAHQSGDFISVINKILRCSENTLNFMDVFLNPNAIPRFQLDISLLRVLKYIRLSDDYHRIGNGRSNSFEPGRNKDVHRASNFSRAFGSSHLLTLHLDTKTNVCFSTFCSIIIPAGSRTFFAKNLVMNKMNSTVSLYANNLAATLPCVIKVKITCVSINDITNSLWQAFPLAESIELCNVSSNGNDSGRNLSAVKVDAVFTGFSTGVCEMLQRDDIFRDVRSDDLRHFRKQPSICDLKNLTEFKMIFTDLEAPLATVVTGRYAFQTMPNLKVTFSYDPDCKKGRDIQNNLVSLAPFVRFVPK